MALGKMTLGKMELGKLSCNPDIHKLARMHSAVHHDSTV